MWLVYPCSSAATIVTSSSGNIFRVTGPLCGEFTGSPVNSPHKGQWRGALIFSLICINGWVNNYEAGDLRRHRVHYDVTVMNCLNASEIILADMDNIDQYQTTTKIQLHKNRPHAQWLVRTLYLRNLFEHTQPLYKYDKNNCIAIRWTIKYIIWPCKQAY